MVNEAHFFMSHRLAVAKAALAAGYEVHVAAPEDHVWAPETFSVEAVREAGFTFHGIPLSRRGTRPWQELKTVAALVRLYRAVRPQLVHLVTIKPILYGGVAARIVGIPAMVGAVTGLGQVFTARGLWPTVLRTCVTFAYRIAMGHRNGRVIVQNSGDRQALIAVQAVAPERVILIRGSGVSLERFSPTPEPAGIPLVVLPARMIWEKGIGDFVEAGRLVREAGLGARFALVGRTHSDNPRAVPEGQLRAWHDSGMIEWWGWRDDMASVFASCHVVCLPSGYGEGVPRALIEAAACTRPIVATNIPGCREIVRDGKNGLLTPVGDVPALAAALTRLIEDGDLRRRMGAAGRLIAEDGFSEADIAERTVALYRDLLPATTGG